MANIFSTEERGGFASNLAYAVIAQGIGFLSSVLTSLVLPKCLDVEDYAYWQLFILYSSYAGFTLFGINDGIYLRIGGRKYSEVDQCELKAQQVVILAFQLLVAGCCSIAIGFAGFEQYRKFVLLLCLVFGLLTNMTSCLRYVFQCTNLTRISSMADLISKGLFVAFMGTLLLLGVKDSLPFIVCYTICQAAALIYILICARETLAAKSRYSGIFKVCIHDMAAGLKIMVAYYADSFIVGFTRMLTDWRLGLVAFGRLSLSFSLINFALTFIGQVSMVAFPVLKRLDSSEQKARYASIRLLLHVVLPLSYLLYVPAKLLLELWLPDYGDSFRYLALTMPLCVYSCKANLLFTTYLKMDRKEGCLCVVNVATMILNGVFSCIGILGFSSVELATCGIVIAAAVRDLLFEAMMTKKFGGHFFSVWAVEAVVSAVFMVSSWTLGVWSWFIVALVLIWHSWFFRRGFSIVYSEVKRRISRQ